MRDLVQMVLTVPGVFVVVVLAILTFVLHIALKAAGNLAADEARGWLAKMSRGLVADAADRLPAGPERERYAEELAAELEVKLVERPISAVAWSIGIRYSARALARSTGVQLQPAQAARSDNGTRVAVALEIGATPTSIRRFASAMAAAVTAANLAVALGALTLTILGTRKGIGSVAIAATLTGVIAGLLFWMAQRRK
jgi:hypothetical protein